MKQAKSLESILEPPKEGSKIEGNLYKYKVIIKKQVFPYCYYVFAIQFRFIVKMSLNFVNFVKYLMYKNMKLMLLR